MENVKKGDDLLMAMMEAKFDHGKFFSLWRGTPVFLFGEVVLKLDQLRYKGMLFVRQKFDGWDEWDWMAV